MYRCHSERAALVVIKSSCSVVEVIAISVTKQPLRYCSMRGFPSTSQASSQYRDGNNTFVADAASVATHGYFVSCTKTHIMRRSCSGRRRQPCLCDAMLDLFWEDKLPPRTFVPHREPKTTVSPSGMIAARPKSASSSVSCGMVADTESMKFTPKETAVSRIGKRGGARGIREG